MSAKMCFINVLSLSPDVNDWLANSRQPRILHVFEHVCNLINERREVLSIVTPQIGNGPFNLVIDDDVLFSDHLNLQSPISVLPTQLNLGDLTINTEDAKLWSPRPDWEVLHAKRNHIIKLLLTNYQTFGLDTCTAPNAARCKCMPFAHRPAFGAGKTTQGYSTTTLNQNLPITNYQSPISNYLISILSSSLAIADLPSSIIATQKLAGLGIGLTPAGDDFIMGAIYAAWIIHPEDVARVLTAELTEVAAALTTSLSAAWLRSAGRGETGILWHEYFDALISIGRIGNPTYAMAVQESTYKILAVGETSGADALAGFIGTMMCWANS